MSPAHQIQLILLQKSAHDLLSEYIADSSLRFSPHFYTPLRIGPKQVAEQSSIGDISWPYDRVDLFDCSEFWRESAVHAENAVFNEGGDGHAVEAIYEAFPEFNIVSTFA